MRFSRPPGAILLAAGTGAGLLTGLSHFGEPLLVIPVLLLAAWSVRAQRWWPLFPACALGMLLGSSARARDAKSCAASFSAGKLTIELELIDPGAGSGRVRPSQHRCNGDVVARWPAGSDWPAGMIMRVEGKWLPRARPLGRQGGQLMIYHATGTPGRGADTTTWVSQLRTYLARSSIAIYGKRAPLVDALVTGRRGDLDPQLKAAFASAGLVHLLAISGFHIGLLAAWVALLLRLLKQSRRRVEVGATLAAIGYAAFLGWPAPATRAALLILLYTFCRWRQRHPQTTALLGASVLPILLIDPWAITDIGAWLSVVALAGLTTATRWSDRAIGEANSIRVLSASIGATAATAPLTALVFGQVAPIAILLSVVAGPLASVMQPAIMASLVLWKVAPFLAGSLAVSSGLLLQLFESIVRFGATAPGAGIPQEPGWGVAWPWLLLLAALLWAIHGRSTWRVAAYRLAWAGTGWCWFLLIGKLPTAATVNPGELGLFFLDVGQGDATLIRTPNGHWIGIDAGPNSARWDAGEKVVAPFLRRQGVHQLDLFVASHAHRDHIGGAAALFRQVKPRVVLEPGEPFLDAGYLDWLGIMVEEGIRWRIGTPGLSWEIDGVSFTVLHPPPTWGHRSQDLNEDSIVLEVRFGNFAALFSGDAGFSAESLFAPALGHVDLLKVGHHGSRGASSDFLLDAITPHAAVISVGENSYGHPSNEALARLHRVGAEVVRTDQEGTITVSTDGRTVNVRGARTTSNFIANGTRSGR